MLAASIESRRLAIATTVGVLIGGCATQDARGLRGTLGATYASPSGNAPTELTVGARYYLPIADETPVLDRIRILAGVEGVVAPGLDLALTSKTSVPGLGKYLGLGGRALGGLGLYLGYGVTVVARGEYQLAHAILTSGAYRSAGEVESFVSASGALGVRSVGGAAELILGISEGFPYNFIFGVAYRSLSFEGEYDVEVEDNMATDSGNRAAQQMRLATYPGTFSLNQEESGVALYVLMQF